MPRYLTKGLLCSLFLLAWAGVSSATPELTPIEAADARQRLGGLQVAVLEDAAGKLPIEEVAQAWSLGAFELSPEPQLNRGATDAVFWLRLQLANPDAGARRVLLSHDYAPMDDVRLYIAGADGVFVESLAGDSAQREPGGTRTRLAAFELDLPGQASVPVFVRIATTSNMNLEMSLWPPERFHYGEYRTTLVYGALFGGIAATILYLLYAARLAREPNALLLAAYLAAYSLYLAFLNGFPSLWLPAALVGQVNNLHLMSLGLLFGIGAMFYRRFLQLATYGPRFDRVAALLQWLGFSIVLAPVLPLALVGLILGIVAGIGPLLTSGYAFYLWYRRREFADVFAIGWAVAHFSSLAGTLRVSGALPNSDLLLHLPAVGCAVACGFFTWAIARRVGRERTYAYTDYLTGLANRRQFGRQGDIEFDRARRYGRSLSLLVLDVDHFKRVNDTWGHSFGDRVLANVANLCRDLSRDSDLVARIGGEEFALLLMETDLDDASRIAARLLASQAEARVDGQGITVSIGVAAMTSRDENFQVLFERADAALYSAKQAGRNQLQVNWGSTGEVELTDQS